MLVPIFAVVLLTKIPLNKSYASASLSKRIIAFAFLWLFIPLVCATPFFYLSEGNPHDMPLRVQGIYDLLTGSLLGLVIEGAFFSFAACFGFYLLLSTLRRSK